MDVANKDDSLLCVSIGRRALADGDLAKAERMVAKAGKLYQCPEVSKLALAIASAKASGSAASSGRGAHSGSANGGSSASARASGAGIPPRGGAASASAASNGHSHDAEAHASAAGVRRRHAEAEAVVDTSTPEQRALVAEILAAGSDLYATLSLQRSATDDDIKKAYRKLALKLHPDKNKAHRAEEAFKAVSKAFSCLSDPQKRAYYDRTGYESTAAAQAAQAQRSASGRVRQQQGGGMQFSEDFDADQIFNMFFGGGMQGQMFRAQFGAPRRPQARQAAPAGGGTAEEARTPGHNVVAGLVQLLPVLLLLLLTLFSSASSPSYQLSQDSRYPARLRTQRLDVPYYVPSEYEFERSYPIRSSARTKLERQVESDHYERLSQRCQSEQITRQRMRYSFRQRDTAKDFAMPNCDEVDSINRRLGRAY
ncbi:hypothetical protein FOA52_008235 [Chlamydomonas sp. UWO 241]|nr:hypothetical protein FOA52_008235 [Chlamydomonas sp. UWO 241]